MSKKRPTEAETPAKRSGPTCQEFADRIGHDQAHGMGIPFTNELMSDWEARKSAPPTNGAAVTDKPRKPREKTKYVIERWDESPVGAFHDVNTGEADFSDTADAIAWAQENVPAPAEVRVIVVKAHVHLEVVEIKKTVVKPA